MNKNRLVTLVLVALFLALGAQTARAEVNASAKATAAAQESAKGAQTVADAELERRKRDMLKNQEQLKKDQNDWASAVDYGKNLASKAWDGAKDTWNSITGQRPAYNPLNDPAWVGCTKQLTDGYGTLINSAIASLGADRLSVGYLDQLKPGWDRLAAQFPKIHDLSMTVETCREHLKVLPILQKVMREAEASYAAFKTQDRTCANELLADTKAFDAIRQSFMNQPANERRAQRAALDTELKANIGQVNAADGVAKSATVRPYIHPEECAKLKTTLAASKTKLATFQQESAEAAACRMGMDPERRAFRDKVAELKRNTGLVADVQNRVIPLLTIADDIERTTNLANADDFVTAAECSVARATMARSITTMQPLLDEIAVNLKGATAARGCLRDAFAASETARVGLKKYMDDARAKYARETEWERGAIDRLSNQLDMATRNASQPPETMAACTTLKVAIAAVTQELAAMPPMQTCWVGFTAERKTYTDRAAKFPGGGAPASAAESAQLAAMTKALSEVAFNECDKGVKLARDSAKRVDDMVAAHGSGKDTVAPVESAALVKCRDQQQSFNDGLIRNMADAKAQGRVSREEQAASDAIAARAQARRAPFGTLGKAGLTLAECQQIEKDLIADAVAFGKIQASDPACIASNKAADDRLTAAIGAARAAGKFDANEEGVVRNIERRIATRRMQLVAGLQVEVCNTLTRDIAQDQNQITVMAASDPNATKIAECRLGAQAMISETLTEMVKAKADGRVDVSEVNAGNIIVSALNARKAALDNPKLLLVDCEDHRTAVVAEKAKFTALISNPTPINGDMETIKPLSTQASRAQNVVDRVGAGLRRTDDCVKRLNERARQPFMAHFAPNLLTVTNIRFNAAALTLGATTALQAARSTSVNPQGYVDLRTKLNGLETDVIAFEASVSKLCAPLN